MSIGRVVTIHVVAAKGATPDPRAEVHAVAGRGIDGEHHAREGADPKRQVTLVEAEAIEGLARDYGITLAPGASRRNITTRGVALNHLVGREFQVGEARVRGIELCEPCAYLESLTEPGVRRGLVHRGGLRAEIVAGGTIRVGDPIEWDG